MQLWNRGLVRGRVRDFKDESTVFTPPVRMGFLSEKKLSHSKGKGMRRYDTNVFKKFHQMESYNGACNIDQTTSVTQNVSP